MSQKLIGQILLEQYRVDAFIASGGMGAVYRVFDLKRNVPLAMKLLHAELAEDPTIFKRFQREARALQKLAHPNIVPFYDVKQAEGLTFLLVRYIDGMTLKDLLRGRGHQPLSINEALTYLKALCAALGYAHANGVVHCDVKPGNIMVERGGTIYLTDFGIARHAESTATAMASMGTAAYMAPEQIRGEAVNPATDIYALGVLLYELLVGLRPFRSEPSAATEQSGEASNERIRYLHLHSSPPDPSSQNPDISPALSQVILKALAKEPQARYASTQELFNAACQAAGVHPDQVPETAAPISGEAPRATPARGSAPKTSTSAAGQPGARMIGRYVVLREIGRGGMATVYVAHDPLFNRDVAIKMLPPELLHDPSFRARFEREAQTVAALEHPAIVPVYDYGEAEGRPYFVMRLMSGDSLAERIAKGPQPLSAVIKLLQRIAPALDEAHSRGVVHRDLKPGNILYDQYDEPYLTDFGIAKLKEGGATLTGENIVGTPAYMSPEQGRGEPDLDGRSDVYSLGCIIYEMLTGKVPYEASTSMGQVVKHLTAPIPNIGEARPDLPPGLQDVINRALAKRKFARFASASELAQALAALANGQELPAMPASRPATAAVSRPATGGLPPVQKPPTGQTPYPPQRPPTGQMPPTAQKPPSGTLPPLSASPAMPPQKKSRAWLVWLVIVLVLAGAVYAGLTYLPGLLRQQVIGEAPLATTPQVAASLPTDTPPPAPTNTPQPTHTSAPTPTVQPTDTAVPEASSAATSVAAPVSSGPVIGGADKIAFVKENDIWMANLDASDPIRLTTTGGYKTELQWTPDRNHVKFIMGKCALLVDIRDQSLTPILCANWADYLASFQISPDGRLVAMTTSDGLFILPYNLDNLRTIKRLDQLANASGCLQYSEHEVKRTRWSADGKMLATVIIGSDAGRSVDLIWVASITCGSKPVDVETFPADRFTMTKYAQTPIIESFGWDGSVNFALNVNILANYGDFYTYNMQLRKGIMVNPLNNGRCCYRDFTWSPDGEYILFAYLDINYGTNIKLYYENFGLLGQGQNYIPLPFPDDFFPADRNAASPQPALRPAP